MTAENQNFSMKSGDSRTITVTVDDGAIPPVAVDISGFDVWWEMSPLSSSGAFSGTPTLQKDSLLAGGVAITDGPNGVFQVTLAPTDTDPLSGDFYHEAQVKDGSGNISTVLTGKITIGRDLITAA